MSPLVLHTTHGVAKRSIEPPRHAIHPLGCFTSRSHPCILGVLCDIRPSNTNILLSIDSCHLKSTHVDAMCVWLEISEVPVATMILFLLIDPSVEFIISFGDKIVQLSN